MALPATEPFTGTGALSASWTIQKGSIERISDQCWGVTVNVESLAFWNADAFSSGAHYSKWTVVSGWPSSGFAFVTCRAKETAGSLDCYFMASQGGGGGAVYGYFLDGAETDLGSDGPTFANGDVEEIRSITGGFQLFKNGAQAGGDKTDSTLTGGSAGIGFFSFDERTDNWEGGNVAGGAADVLYAQVVM